MQGRVLPLFKIMIIFTLARVDQWLQRRPVHPKDAGSVPGHRHAYLGCKFNSGPSRARTGGNQSMCLSLS